MWVLLFLLAFWTLFLIHFEDVLVNIIEFFYQDVTHNQVWLFLGSPILLQKGIDSLYVQTYSTQSDIIITRTSHFLMLSHNTVR